ncbi:MAG: Fe-S protein assembly co-chaperone HscB [Myxococcota bacterium]
MAGGYFELLGLPERFEIDAALLERAYLERSRETHPDRFASAPASERVAAVQRSIELNDAYRTLKKAVPRAEYLMSRAGVTIGDNERSADHDFLMRILALREELADARAAGRTEEVAALERAMLGHHNQLVGSLPAKFAAGDLAAIKQTLIELRYVDRYLQECDAALDDDAV